MSDVVEWKMRTGTEDQHQVALEFTDKMIAWAKDIHSKRRTEL